MSNKWEDYANTDFPSVSEEKTKKVEENNWIEREFKSSGSTAWDYERIRFYKMLGWVEFIKKTDYGSYKTGEIQIVATSKNTYSVKENTSRLVTRERCLRLDKSKVNDWQKYNELSNEIDDFLSQARNKFGTVSPALLHKKEWLRYTILTNSLSLIVFGAMVIPFPFYVALLLKKTHKQRKKYSSYVPLSEAYYEKIKDFETQIKQITSF
jgi:hypothetical protein